VSFLERCQKYSLLEKVTKSGVLNVLTLAVCLYYGSKILSKRESFLERSQKNSLLEKVTKSGV
jgi:hypothetical protein